MATIRITELQPGQPPETYDTEARDILAAADAIIKRQKGGHSVWSVGQSAFMVAQVLSRGDGIRPSMPDTRSITWLLEQT